MKNRRRPCLPHNRLHFTIPGAISASKASSQNGRSTNFAVSPKPLSKNPAASPKTTTSSIWNRAIAPKRPACAASKRPPNKHPVYERMLRHSALLDIVAQLIGPGIRTTGQKLNMKSPEIGSPVEWHQDWAFVPQTNDDLLTVGIALDDMTLENGCLLVIPGSHKGRIYDHHQDGAFVGAVTEPDFTPEGAVPIELRAGDISIHHFRLLHGSAPNTSSRPRRLLLLEYAAADAWPLLGADWETFKASILRGKPSCEPRLTSVPVRLPLPPAKRRGSIYETQSTLKRPLYSGKGRF